MKDELFKYKKYAIDVVEKRVVAGEYIYLACKQYLALFQHPDIEFVPSRVDRVSSFISTLKHYTGVHAGKPFQLEPWQYWLVCNIYGFQRKETKKRLLPTGYSKMWRNCLFRIFSLL